MGKSDALKVIWEACGSVILNAPVADWWKLIMCVDASAAVYRRGGSLDGNDLARAFVTFLHMIWDQMFKQSRILVFAYDYKPVSEAKAATQAGRVTAADVAAAKTIDPDDPRPACNPLYPEQEGDHPLDLPSGLVAEIEKDVFEELGGDLEGLDGDERREVMRQLLMQPMFFPEYVRKRKRRILDSFDWKITYPESVWKMLKPLHARFNEQCFLIALASYTPPRDGMLIFNGATPSTYADLMLHTREGWEISETLQRRADRFGFDPERGICPYILYTDSDGMRHESTTCSFFGNMHDEADALIPWIMQKAWFVSLFGDDQSADLRFVFDSPDALETRVAEVLPRWLAGQLPSRTVIINGTDTDFLFIGLHALLVLASGLIHTQAQMETEDEPNIGSSLVRHIMYGENDTDEAQIALPFKLYLSSHTGAGVYRHTAIHGVAHELARRFETTDIDRLAAIARTMIVYYCLFMGIDYQRKVYSSNTLCFAAFWSRRLSDVNAGRWPDIFPQNRATPSVWRILIHLFRTYEGQRRARNSSKVWPKDFACDILIAAEKDPGFRKSDLDAYIFPAAFETLEDCVDATFSPVAGSAIVRAHTMLVGRLYPKSWRPGNPVSLGRWPHPLTLINSIVVTTAFSTQMMTLRVFYERAYLLGSACIAYGGMCFGLRDSTARDGTIGNVVSFASWDPSERFPEPKGHDKGKGRVFATKISEKRWRQTLERPYFQAVLDEAPENTGIRKTFATDAPMDIQAVESVTENEAPLSKKRKRGEKKPTKLLEVNAMILKLQKAKESQARGQGRREDRTVYLESTKMTIVDKNVAVGRATAMTHTTYEVTNITRDSSQSVNNLLEGLAPSDLDFEIDSGAGPSSTTEAPPRPAKRPKNLKKTGRLYATLDQLKAALDSSTMSTHL